MSILIRGMEMPKHGSYRFTVRYDADGNLCVYPLVYMPGFDDRDMKHETPMFPIVSVPPHGNLKDADVLIKMAYQKQRTTPSNIAWLGPLDIAVAPTIIEAEG